MVFFLIVFLIGCLVGLIAGIIRIEWYIKHKTRRMVCATNNCYMCPDCPKNCPLEPANKDLEYNKQ